MSFTYPTLYAHTILYKSNNPKTKQDKGTTVLCLILDNGILYDYSGIFPWSVSCLDIKNAEEVYVDITKYLEPTSYRGS